MVAELVRKPRLIGETEVFFILFCVGKGYLPRKVLKHLTVQSLVFSGSFTVKRIETVAVQSTIDTERNGDSRRICSNDHVAGQQHALTAENLQFRRAGSPGLAEVATTVGQAVQTAISECESTIK